MGAPTPRATALVVAPAAGPVAPAAPTPRLVRTVAPPRPTRLGWTMMVVPPARANGAVRAVALRRRHLVLPLLGAALLLAGASFGAALLGLRVHEARVAPELDVVRLELEGAEAELRTLGDSLAALRGQVASLAAAAEARAATRAVAAPTRRARPRASLVRAPGVVLPVEGRITSLYSRTRVHPILRIRRPHKGLDIAAPSGTAIAAPAAGRVTKVGRELGYGLVVHIDHGGGVTSRYAHCRSTSVSPGDRVDAGQVIAAVGRTGLATAPHLHWEVRVRGEAVDPLRTPIGRAEAAATAVAAP